MKIILNIVSLIAVTFQFPILFTTRVYANVELPQIPQRPSIEELKENLTGDLSKNYTSSKKQVKIPEDGSRFEKFSLRHTKKNIDKNQ